MAPSSKPDYHINLNYIPQLSASQPHSGSSTANTSPIESSAGNPMRSAFANANGYASAGSTPGATRLGAGSPSHELGGRLYSKRAREIQNQERLTPNFWGPPTSGNSTPLRENIPESPTGDGFPDLMPPTEDGAQTPGKRARAGTVPSRFSPGGALNGHNLPPSMLPKSSRPTPSTSPFQPASVSNGDARDSNISATAAGNSALLSRLRAGSMPQRTNYVGNASPFGPSLFSTTWSNGRERATTLTSIHSNDPSSPAHSSYSKEGLNDSDVKTLDYLGLVDTPQQARATLARPTMETLMEGQRASAMQPFIADLAGLKNSSRFRSYSVNAKEKYAEEEEDELDHASRYSGYHSGSLTPSAASAAAALAATQAQIHQHNLAVQAFANHASASRPRARTAGVLESPPQRSMRSYLATPSRLDSSISASDLIPEGGDYDGLPEAVQAMHLNGMNGRSATEGVDEHNLEGPTRALWLGSIPPSTTVTSLNAIFGIYGRIESARVLTHKNCGFVNFEHVESAIQAKSLLNGKEIFPGAGAVRIGYAKVPSASASGTPGPNGIFPSPSPDPHSKAQSDDASGAANGLQGPSQVNGQQSKNGSSLALVPELSDMQTDMLDIVTQFGANEDEQVRIAASIEEAVVYNNYEPEIPPIPESSHNRIHDAPRLREIRKRIDNNSCSQAEIEEIAIGMLPEIAELSSDYLGNTVVQKLFEYCSESVKESMLTEIAPHMAEIGVHKNGTWAAQKIIEVAKTPSQMSMIVENLRPHIVSLFLDQYGNYVLQGCLRFGYPWDRAIFETMLSRMWEISQGRFGARAMRACLESHHATKDQQRMLAAAIALHSVQLATNTNGALLLTWFLDTCTFPRRRTVLAPLLVPHLVHLCTHKVAYLTVLKVINQRNESEARDTILRALFFSPNDQNLEEILADQSCGATLIFKVLTTPFIEESMRSDIVQNVRSVLTRIKAQPSQGYKRLMDEVGLSTRNGGRESHTPRDNHIGRTQSRERSRPTSQHTSLNPAVSQPVERQSSSPYYQPMPQQYDPADSMPRSGAVDPNAIAGYDQFGLNGLRNMGSPMYAPNPIAPMTAQQLQYQQAMIAASTRNMSGSYYPGITSAGLAGYAAPSSPGDNFRTMSGHGSPMGPQSQMSPPPMYAQSGFASPAFSPMMGGQMMAPGFQYQMQYLPPQPQQQQGGGRRGRVSAQ
ncbi:MAG: hypothetical protein M1819_004268 [Sarea resinae]|nr:MAG: hypothetical protein M1819_004268 [Sarea resinae]